MPFEIATGGPEAPRTKSGMVDEGLNVDLSNGTRAERLHRQIIDNIEACETSIHLMGYWMDEGTVLTALQRSWPEFYALAHDRYETQLAILIGCERPSSAPAEPCPAVPDSPSAHGGKSTMFDFDTGNSGSEGPWIGWSARGSQDGTVPQKSFFLREGSDKVPFAGFDRGVVLDVENMRTGWQRSDGVVGQAPDWKWNPNLGSFIQQPGEDYKKGFQIRCAIGEGKAATWEQAGAAAWNAFVNLVPAIQQGLKDGMLPLVKLTGTKAVQFKRGSTVEPILEIIKWVPRPDCLKEGASAGIATDPAPKPQPASQPAPQAQTTPADTSAVAEDVEF